MKRAMVKAKKNWAEKLKNLRQSFGLEQQHLARVMGVSPSAISRWESGALVPKSASASLINLLDRQVESASKKRLELVKCRVLVLLDKDDPLAALIRMLSTGR